VLKSRNLDELQTLTGRAVTIPASVRLDVPVYMLVCERAHEAGLTVSEYLRRSIKDAMQRGADNGRDE